MTQVYSTGVSQEVATQVFNDITPVQFTVIKFHIKGCRVSASKCDALSLVWVKTQVPSHAISPLVSEYYDS